MDVCHQIFNVIYLCASEVGNAEVICSEVSFQWKMTNLYADITNSKGK
jgi:hypothetical protein